MHQIIDPGTPVVNVAKATETTGVRHLPCSTPGCEWHAAVRATVDVHLTRVGPLPFGDTRSTRLVMDHCLSCYGQLRRGQGDGHVEIVAAVAL